MGRPAQDQGHWPDLLMAGSALGFAVMGALAHGLADALDWRLVLLGRASTTMVLATAMAPGPTLALLRHTPPALWARSLAGSLAIVLTFFALPRLPITHVVTLRNTTPVWVALFARLTGLAKSGSGRSALPALAAAMAGVWLLERPDLGGWSPAASAALLAGAATGAGMLGLHLLGDLAPEAVVAHFSAASTLAALVGCAWGPAWPDPAGLVRPEVAVRLLGVGLAGTVGQLAMTRAYGRGAPVRMALVGVLEVVFAAGLDAACWGRALGPSQLLGVGLVLAAPVLLRDQRDLRQ